MKIKVALIFCIITVSFLLINCGEEHKYQKAVKNDNIQSFESYLDNYPNGKHTKEAVDQIEFLKYKKAKMEATEDSYKKFLKEYPDGKHSQEINYLLYPYKKEYKGHIYTIVSIEKKKQGKGGGELIKIINKDDILFSILLVRNSPIKRKEFIDEFVNKKKSDNQWLKLEYNALTQFTPKYISTKNKRYEVAKVTYKLLPESDKMYFCLLIFFVIPENAYPTEFVMGEIKYDLTKLEIGKKYNK